MSDDNLLPRFRFIEFKDDETWTEKSLEQVSEVNPPTSSLPGSFVYIDLESVEDGALLRKKKITLEQAPSRAQRLLKKGDIIYQMVRPYQKNNYFFKIEDDLNYVASTGYAQLRAYQTPMYLFQYLHYQKFVDKVLAKSTGSNYPAINSTDLAKLTVWTSSEKEQQKIADCLSSLDELIAAHTEKLTALKAHKKGLMQQLFPAEGETVPKLRFEEFEDDLQHLGFSELGEIKIGLTHTPNYIDSGIIFLSSRNISKGYIDFKNVQYISKQEYESMPESTKPKVGDILFTRVGSNLGNPIILEEEKVFGIFVSLGIFRVNKKALNFYIKYWMESDFFWIQLEKKVAGGAKNNLNTNWLKEFEIAIPSVLEQTKIAGCLSSLENLITTQIEKIVALKSHKKGLMQGLFPVVDE